MAGRGLVRTVYSWASEVPALGAPMRAVRSNPHVRALARRHVGVLLARGTTWANVDGALRLLAEDREQTVVFGPWRGRVAAELLYWAPFVRWAQEHFSFDPDRVAVVSATGAGHWYAGACGTFVAGTEVRPDLRRGTTFAPGPVLSLVGQYRAGRAAPRPLIKRSAHVLLRPAAGTEADRPPAPYVAVDLGSRDGAAESLAEKAAVIPVDRTGPWPARHALLAGATGLVTDSLDTALLGALSGVPVVALRAAGDGVAEPDLDLAIRVTSALGGSLTILEAGDLASLREAVGGA
jgi:hypothetical protein